MFMSSDCWWDGYKSYSDVCASYELERLKTKCDFVSVPNKNGNFKLVRLVPGAKLYLKYISNPYSLMNNENKSLKELGVPKVTSVVVRKNGSVLENYDKLKPKTS